MPTTTNKGYEVPARGTFAGTWDTPMNGNFNIMDANLGGIAIVPLASTTPVTLSSSQAQNAIIRFTGTLTANITVVFPTVGGFYIIDNLTVGNFFILLTNGVGNNIAIPQGSRTTIFTTAAGGMQFANDWTDFVGKLTFFYGASAPSWIANCSVPPYLVCNGASFSAVTYPVLNQVLGGTTLPDFRGRSFFMLDGGTGRLTSATMTPDGNTIGATGGLETITLTSAQIPAHSHPNLLTDPGHAHAEGTNTFSGQVGGSVINTVAVGGAQVPSVVANTTGITITNANNVGGGGSHNNVPPGIVGGLVMIRAA